MPQLKTKDTPDRRDKSDDSGDLSPAIDFGDAINIMLNTPPLKTTERPLFTVHQGAADETVEVKTDTEQVAQPFVKWVGGKRSLLNAIKPLLPPKFGEYYEPFVGGGALFFTVADRAQHAYLSDRNFELVLTYQAIKQDPDKLIERLKTYAASHGEEAYYKVRAEEYTDPIEVAARFLYLNKTCYNGLYRVNKSGKFNVPIGNYKNPNIIQEDNIRACHNLLEKATILYRDYKTIQPKAGDFVYFDPPYHPTDDLSFKEYTKENFSEQDQHDLRDFALKLTKAGVYVMLSNSKTKFIEDLYKNKAFTQHAVQAPRFVNCKPNARGMVDELLITNY